MHKLRSVIEKASRAHLALCLVLNRTKAAIIYMYTYTQESWHQSFICIYTLKKVGINHLDFITSTGSNA